MELIIRAPFKDPSGYSYASRKILQAAFRYGLNIRTEEAHSPSAPVSLTTEEARLLQITENTFVSSKSPLLTIALPTFFKLSKTGFSMGYTMLESDRISKDWVSKCNSQDLIFVPSEFNRKTFINSGVLSSKIQLLPLGVDTEIFKPEAQAIDVKVKEMFIPDSVESSFIFFSNLEWIGRKNAPMLLKAYCETFNADEPVVLLLKAYVGGSAFEKFYRESKDKIREYLNEIGYGEKHPRIVLVPAILNENEMAALYRLTDCYVTPTAGEGFCLPLVESLATGVPVIATRWSAHLDYLNDDNGYLIDVEELVDVPKYGNSNDIYYEGSKWAKPSIESLKHLLRHVYDNREEAEQKAINGFNYVQENLTWNHTATKLIQILSATKDAFKPFTRIPIEVKEKLNVGMIIPSLADESDIVAKNALKLAEHLKDKINLITVPHTLSPENRTRIHNCQLLDYEYEYELFDPDILMREWLSISNKALCLSLHSVDRSKWRENDNFLTHADQIIVKNNAMREALGEKKTARPVLVLPYGVDKSNVEFESAKEITTDIHLGTAGLCLQNNNFAMLLIVVSALKKMGKNIKLTMLANVYENNRYSRSYEQTLEYLIDYYNLKDCVQWIKTYVDKEVANILLHQCDVIVLPYEENTIRIRASFEVAEVMTALKPIIISDVSYFSDLRDTLFLLSKKIQTPADYYRAIMQVLDNVKLRDKALELIKDHMVKNSWDKISQNYVQIWTKLVKDMQKKNDTK